MLKTNNKKAKENLKAYIMENFDESYFDYDEAPFEDLADYKNVCTCIFNVMMEEKRYNRSVNDFETFKDWAQGLPSILNTCYYYDRSAKVDLTNILEETEEEAEKFTEQQAEERLTWLLYREINHNRIK